MIFFIEKQLRGTLDCNNVSAIKRPSINYNYGCSPYENNNLLACILHEQRTPLNVPVVLVSQDTL